MARAICGCYRRDEAHDPDTFAAALAVVLCDYPAEIVRYAADPRTGVIVAFPMGLPNVGQIRQYLDGVMAKQERLRRYAALPKMDCKRLPKLPAGAGALANVFVAAGTPTYARMCEKAKTGDAREFQFEEGGIRVALSWFEMPSQIAKHFKVPSDADLRSQYPKPQAAADHDDPDYGGEYMGHGEAA